ncbi:MAG: heavy-metal-associated domain-containing protein [Terriglobales bacterium]
MTEVTIRIGGMSCQHCVATVERSLQGGGTGRLQVAVGLARVEYDPARIGPEAIRQRIREAGYEPEAT